MCLQHVLTAYILYLYIHPMFRIFLLLSQSFKICHGIERKHRVFSMIANTTFACRSRTEESNNYEKY